MIRIIATSGAGSTAPEARNVLRLDPGLDELLCPDAQLEILHKDHDAFFEGPTWVSDAHEGSLIFTDIAGNAIRRWRPNGELSTVADEIFRGADRSEAHLFDLGSRQVLLVGANGTTLDAQGRITYCGYGTRQVARIEPDGTHRVLADRFGGRLLNTPNDLVFRSDGTLYFTDSAADRRRGEDDPQKGVSHSGVYLLKEGRLRLLIDDFVVPNGLAFAPDERVLYINDTRRKLIMRFDVLLDGHVANGELFADMNVDPAPGVPDGMKVDRRGNVYCTGPGGLWILSPEGRHIGTVLTPERLTNLTFGARDGKTMFLTGPSYLYRIAIR
jgi:gluconolactonase